jgi:DTW domain-containing protein YfiP
MSLPDDASLPEERDSRAPWEPRAVCMRCRRPEIVCYCKHLGSFPTKTRVVLLQHPRERDMAIGTARMASLCLPNSELHVGVRWQGSTELARVLSDPERPAALLSPGPGAIDVSREPPRGPVTLVVVDGTWWQTKKIVKENPELAALPRYAFTPEAPSEYRIRREPRDDYVSTIEALAAVLSVLEGKPHGFDELLVPFRAMVDMQIAWAERPHARSRHARKLEARLTRLPAWLRDRPGDLVCIAGEGNAWPYRREVGSKRYPDELTHWVGRRAATGETFEHFIAPKNPIAPRTAEHVGVSLERLLAGGTPDDLHRCWAAFLRPTDIVCRWGSYAADLFEGAGGPKPKAELDLRHIVRAFQRGHVGTLDAYAEATGFVIDATDDARGRAGRRVAQIAHVARHLCKIAGEPGRVRD